MLAQKTRLKKEKLCFIALIPFNDIRTLKY